MTARKDGGPRLDFTLELSCACTPPICRHAAPGIAKLVQAAYFQGRADGQREAARRIAKSTAKSASVVAVSKRAPTSGPVRVRQKGSRRTQ